MLGPRTDFRSESRVILDVENGKTLVDPRQVLGSMGTISYISYPTVGFVAARIADEQFGLRLATGGGEIPEDRADVLDSKFKGL